MASVSSRALFGIGVAMTVAAISSIFVVMVAGQNQETGGPSGAQQTGGQQGGNDTETAEQATSTIIIPQGAAAKQVEQYYQPNPAQVESGSQVTWQNQDVAPHTATADDGSFDTGNIPSGQSGSATVRGQGQEPYYCTIHPFMTGTLQVSGGQQAGTRQGNVTQQAGQNQTQTAGSETAAANNTDGPSTLSTTGTATVRVEPDRVTVTVGVETNGTTAQKAAAENANITSQVIAAIGELGASEQQIGTSSYNLYPIYEQDPHCAEISPPPPECEPESITGYGASNAISVTLDVGQGVDAGEVIDAAVRAGANEINNLWFFVSQEKQQTIRNDLIQSAIGNARERANAAAEALGMQVSGVKSVDLSETPFPAFRSFEESRLSTQAAETPVLPGEQEVTMSVDIMFYVVDP